MIFLFERMNGHISDMSHPPVDWDNVAFVMGTRSLSVLFISFATMFVVVARCLFRCSLEALSHTGNKGEQVLQDIDVFGRKSATGYVGLTNQGTYRKVLLSLHQSNAWSFQTCFALLLFCDFFGRAGATCYLNSLVQSLFMTPDVRHALFTQFQYSEEKHGKSGARLQRAM
jgi:hypothetical protein